MENKLIEQGKGFYFDVRTNQTHQDGKLHYHNQLEIYFLLEGTCNYFIDSNTYYLQAGDIVIVPPKTLHATMYGGKVHSRMLINCDNYYIPLSVYHFISTIPYIERIPRINSEIEAIFKKIQKEYEHPDDFSKDALHSNISSLLILLLRSEKNRQAVSCNDDFVEIAVSYIQRNYANQISLLDVAKYCAVSCEHLSRSFKKNMGFGFSEYLTLYRLKQAEIMLLEFPSRSVSSIAYNCGFNDSNYFANRFKKIYGISPSQLRKGDTENVKRHISIT